MGGYGMEGATDEQLARLKAMSDDDLLRSAGTIDMFAGVEATRRLRTAVIDEEQAIKRLTRVLVWLTWVSLWLTLVLVALGVIEVAHFGDDIRNFVRAWAG
jgi:hypothetical protein